jgi:hypothetical protein
MAISGSGRATSTATRSAAVARISLKPHSAQGIRQFRDLHSSTAHAVDQRDAQLQRLADRRRARRTLFELRPDRIDIGTPLNRKRTTAASPSSSAWGSF